ncbi:hypothetical protein [Enterococcus gallinarum]|uniref:hypothetical protein n=1 Tax=Enterococcus gallinarum TaxID=1353 RepID=UPI0027DF65DC|nr:hypothetical protein [Enterococcus gallinarum]MDQ6112581.1 hypothetical protein [Enterococcus gallinarum]
MTVSKRFVNTNRFLLRITMIGLRSKTELMVSNGELSERSNLEKNHNDWLAKQDRIDDEQRRAKRARP